LSNLFELFLLPPFFKLVSSQDIDMIPHQLLVKVFNVHDFLRNSLHSLFVVKVLFSLHFFKSTFFVGKFQNN
jgi:hypothetical protein